MARQKIPAEKIEAARQSYFSGKGLREVSKEHGIGYRQLAQACKRGQWASEKESMGIGRERAVALVARAADRRAEAVERSCQGHLVNVIEGTSRIAETVSGLLAKQDLSGADYKELATLLKILTDTLSSLKRLMPDEKEPEPCDVKSLSDAELEAMIRKRQQEPGRERPLTFDISPERAERVVKLLRGERP